MYKGLERWNDRKHTRVLLLVSQAGSWVTIAVSGFWLLARYLLWEDNLGSLFLQSKILFVNRSTVTEMRHLSDSLCGLSRFGNNYAFVQLLVAL
ncbi:hypothetical protein E4T42_03154 [Aureobasidium subglaciale]|uniref:Uncharacterized protein n=1 Tax=Aureobasidium subglaciale (strain EXF-2481) TaxID=1043005 RepID=A0A074YB96_AURSE|nr:uncharacterized protein AUEXF2481DRAFT_464015 [Aureobasidium subglaciale EXF-2481]KAI5202960.1 hypothetical protein E4T38_05366 [Aureobasidium subglaciale]KAI5221841.1 hypothetical protein E4T40_05299 [Aureobasidium subglaciale]KAI5225764.1 hypothetical protein E4T41_05118 [Aureobasidium subglaciale]KAI5252782.1 hypothetical protein E4T42_03154 [Aureobasidium subglaciale]KAI5261642.1 hypothetical protein E4T46_05011 [Aureobasidium subglaciale]